MVGSTQSTSSSSYVLNTIVAEILSEIADELEKASDVKTAAQEILQKIVNEHSRIIYNGDNYTEEWVAEAKKRDLPNIISTVASLETIMDDENVKLFEKHNVLSKDELHARTEVLLEAYSMSINIEARTTLNIAKRQILPAASLYSARLADSVNAVSAAGVSADTQKDMLKKVCGLIKDLHSSIAALEKVVEKAATVEQSSKQAKSYRNDVIPAMTKVRNAADQLEMIVDADLWPLPTYAEMLFLK